MFRFWLNLNSSNVDMTLRHLVNSYILECMKKYALLFTNQHSTICQMI